MVSVRFNAGIWRNATYVGCAIGFVFSTINQAGLFRNDGVGCIVDANFARDLDGIRVSDEPSEMRRVAAVGIFSPIKPNVILAIK